LVGLGCPDITWSAVFHVPSQHTMRRSGITATPGDRDPDGRIIDHIGQTRQSR
jgi:hypothetical protein